LLQKVLRRSRSWYHREFYKYPLHDAVNSAIKLARPDNWHLLVLEHAHMSTDDITMIAYTRDDKSGDADRQVKTSIGKYLRRHFSTLADHQIRDIQALHTASGCKIVKTMAEMLHHLLRGPQSCMKSAQFQTHPYQVYDPSLGWSMAVREANGDTVGRALLHTDENGNTRFVRSYNKDPNNGYSHSDTQLEAWMQSQGIEKQSGWHGAHIRVIDYCGQIIGPFMDGEDREVVRDGKLFRIVYDEGEYRMDNTNGYAEEANQYDHCCEDCNEGFDDGDGYWVGVNEDTYICNDCCNNNYQHVLGRRGNYYYVNYRYAVEVNGEYYDEDYLSDNEIVCDVDGEHHHRDDVIYIESESEYYPEGDDRICYADDTEEYELRENCWQCTQSDKWYTEDIEYVEINGEKFHPDNAPETTEGETE
jgi:hypothetical protein